MMQIYYDYRQCYLGALARMLEWKGVEGMRGQETGFGCFGGSVRSAT